MPLQKRVEVLFDEKEYRRLEEIAREKRQSVGSLVRDAVARYVTHPTAEERQRAWEEFLSLAGKGGPSGSPEEIKEEILRAMDESLAKSLDTD